MRMQLKLTVVLLFVGLVSGGTVGGVAYWMVMRDFRQSVMDQAFLNFQHDMHAYLTTFGGWQTAKEKEDFNQFVHRTRQRHIEHDFAREGRPPVPPRRHGPPFVFLVIGVDGRVLIGGDKFERGSLAPESVLRNARAIEYDGKTALLASPLGQPVLSPQDRSYLGAMRKAIVTGVVVSFLFAMLLGIVFGRSMTSTLKRLTSAIGAMGKNLDQEFQVKVTTNDELGELARTFNTMNCELSQAHKELKELSIRDELTGLYNRRYFDEQSRLLYEQAKRYNQPLSVMIGDLDHFKKINDTFSHEVGDKVLTAIGSLLQENTRKSDVVARYGGEEFVIAFPSSTLQQSAACCNNIRKKVVDYPWHDIHPDLRVTMSMGLCADLTAPSAGKMVSIADNNLYMAKKQGRNRVVSSLMN